MFVNTAWALLPPVIAIVLALITKEAYSSIFIGIVAGALLVTKFNVIQALDVIVDGGIANTEDSTAGMISAVADNAGIFIFLILLGIIVALVTVSGGSAAFGRWAEKNIKSKAGALLATFVLGVLIFIDDYFNCLTVGSVMRPITDTHKISRPKLAYLIDATAAPVCMIAPISSWAAAVSGVADDLDNGVSGIQLFVRAIPYNFYSLLTFVFIIAIVLMKFDYGPMVKYEKLANSTGDLTALEKKEDEKFNPKGRVLDLVLPVIFLIVICTIAMIRVGGYFGGDNAGNFIGAFGDTDAFVALPWGALITLVFTIIYMICRRLINFKEAMECVQKGFFAMVPPILILTLAVTLKSITTSLGAAVFIHNVMEGAAESLYALLPAVIFLVACLQSFATGTSWGTFGILIPIVTAIFPADSPLLIIGISACLAGAVCGDHCSPISDTTIMASAGAQVEHVKHVATQLPYAITVALISFVMFIVAGFVRNALVCILIGAVLTVVVLFILKSAIGVKTDGVAAEKAE